MMFQRIKSFLEAQFSIRPEDNVHPAVAKNFRHNAIINTLDISFFFMADSFWSINTIMPVFAATMTDSPFIIGLIPAIVNAGWFLPQMFLAKRISNMPKIVPYARKMAVLERIPYLLLVVLALLLPLVGKEMGLAVLIVLMIWRGLSGGMAGLPWQEMMARVIPLTHRARFFGFSRMVGQGFGVAGAAILGVILAWLKYPYNYAMGFGLAVIIQWISYAFYRQNRDPEIESEESLLAIEAEEEQKLLQPEDESKAKREPKPNMLANAGEILRKDGNFRLYIIARALSFIGNMGTAFIAVYAIRAFSLNDEQAAVFTGLLFASGIVGYALWGAIGDRIGPKKIVALSFVAWALALAIAILTKTIWIYYLVFVFFGIYSAGIGVGDSMLIMELSDEKLRPTYLGMARTLTGAFFLVAPVLAGWLVNSYGYITMFVVALVFTVLSTVLMLRVHDFPRRKLVKPEV